MKIAKAAIFMAILAIILSFAIYGAAPALGASPDEKPAPILIEAPMEMESTYLVKMLENPKLTVIDGWKFWEGTFGGYPAVVCRSYVGSVNAGVATYIGIKHFKPAAVISQGTSGAHDPSLAIGDIVICKRCYFMDAIATGYRDPGQGSDFSRWRTQEVNALGPDGKKYDMFYFDSSPKLVEAASQLGSIHKKANANLYRGQVSEGIASTTFCWMRERDRIDWNHNVLGASLEEMESAAVAKICYTLNTPFLAVRIISDSEFLPSDNRDELFFDEKTAEECQAFVIDLVKYLFKENILTKAQASVLE